MTEVEIEPILRSGYAHFQAQRYDQAEALYRQVLADNPDHPDGLQFLGLLAGQTKRYPLAIDLLSRVVVMHPKIARLHATLGEYLAAVGNHPAAAVSFRKALELKPEDHGTLANLGAALKNMGEHQAAIDVLQKALALQPDSLMALINLGAVYTEASRFEEAVDVLRKAADLYPNSFEAYVNLGSTLRSLHRVDESISVLNRALELNDQSAEAHNNFGVAMLLSGDLDRAVASFRRAIALNPQQSQAAAQHNLAIALKDQGLYDEALAAHERSITLDPKNAVFHSNRLFSLHLDPRFSPADLLREHQTFNRLLPDIPRVAHLNERLPNRRLKIAYVSPDFRKHAVSFFFLPVLENHNRNQFHVTCYANSPVRDEVTERIEKLSDQFTSIVSLSPDRSADQIRDDQIDILIDLTGHTANSRLLTFARKPAPIQITWLGYPGTTGLAAMDYRISDPYADTPGQTDPFSSEKIIRLPQTAWCFHPLSGSPPVNPLPAMHNHHVTFGTFNNFSKASRAILQLWAQLLLRVPNSRLLLKNNAMRSQTAIQNLRNFFAGYNISPDRLEIITWQESFTDHLQTYHRLDIALDTFPYHGTTTTCEALWMGVPVVTLAGQVHASRVGVSLLTNAGLPNLIAESPEQYVALAAELANDLPRLSGLRNILRTQMQASPLMNAQQFTTHLESAYRRVWQNWCAALTR